jgi:acetoin utilization deacetylase AcuC-like enzyme
MNEFALFYPRGHEDHAEYGHPERPERIESIVQAMKQSGIWEKATLIPSEKISSEILSTVHTDTYLSLLERTSKRGGHLDADTYVTTSSWELALRAAGGACALGTAIWNREARSGIALTRPPGHHAMRGQGMGFCLLNNVALAAEEILRNPGAERMAIVDLDLHHGNGTQDIFYNRPDVLFISTHQQPLYPGTGAISERGQGDGLGTTVNIPMPPGSGDTAYKTVMEQVILPILSRYQPDMLFVSYGFDTHWSDPLGHLLLTASGYKALVHRLHEFAESECQGRLAFVLEGGYDLEAAAVCTVGIVSSFLDVDWVDSLGPSPYPESENWRDMLIKVKDIWGL